MSVLRVGFGVGWFIGSLGLGWWLKRSGWLTDARAAGLMRLVFTVLAPLVLCLTLWGMELEAGHLWALPLIGTVVSASTVLPAAFYARAARLTRPETGSLLTCAFFSNLGYMGAFTAFALYGEQAYALCVLYFLFFSPLFYTVGVGVADRYGHRGAAGVPPTFMAGIQFVPFAGLLVGVALNLAGVPRPPWLGMANHGLIPIDTAAHLLVIGSQLTFESPRRYWRPGVVMSGIKFVYTPAIAWLLITWCGLQGLPRMIVLLEASMPVAVSPLILPLLFGLDKKFSNALWLFTTLVAIPWLLLAIPLLERL